MEMVDIATEGKTNEEDKVEPMPEAKTEDPRNLNKAEEAEPNEYSKLRSPSEDIYSEAFYGDTRAKAKPGKQTEGSTRPYRAACIVLTIICLVLLLVIIALCLKLQTGSTACPVGEDSTVTQGPKCSYDQCHNDFPSFEAQRRSCQECPKGWLTYGQWCFYLSTFRLSWDESQRNCSSKGGSLAVINNQRTQRFLTKEGNMKYWIGLRHTENTWTWVNNTALRESYWADRMPEGDCGILISGNQPVKNWIKAPCQQYLYYICQLKL